MLASNIVQWSPGVTLEAMEKQVILAAFRHYRGNKTATANALGIAIRTLDNKLAAYEADAKKQEKADADEKRKRDEFYRRSRGLPNPTEESQEPSKVADGTGSGDGVESTHETSAKHAMPVSERKEVQGLPSKPAAAGDTRKNG